jgi:hypothetical protein
VDLEHYLLGRVALAHGEGVPTSTPATPCAPSHWSNSKMRWYDGADKKAWPVGLAVFVIAGIAFLVAGLGPYSLLTAFAFARLASTSTRVSDAGERARARARRRQRDRSSKLIDRRSSNTGGGRAKRVRRLAVRR